MDNQPTELQDLNQNNLPAPVTPSQMPVRRRKPRIKLQILLPVLLVLVLLGGGGAALYSQYSNDPTRVWAQAMDRSSNGFLEVIKSASGEPMRGGEVKGSIDIDSPIAADGTMTANWYENTGEFDLTVGAAGIRVNSEVLMMPVEGSKSPDLYIRVDGLQAVESLLGEQAEALSPIIETVDGNWYFLDHTLLDQLGVSAAGESSLSTQDLTDIGSKLAEVIQSRILSSDEDISVLKVEEYLGKEDFEGDNSFKYRVSVQKEQFKDFVVEMKDALEETKLKDLMLQNAEEGTTFEEALEFDKLLEDIEKMNFDDSTAEVWIDAKNKLFRNIRIRPADKVENDVYLDIGLDYNGGDALPFSMTLVNMDKEESYRGSIKLSATLSRSNKGTALGIIIDLVDENAEKISGKATVTIVPSNNEVVVEKPEGAKSILELLGGFMPGALGSEDATLDQSSILDLYQTSGTDDDSEITQEGV